MVRHAGIRELKQNASEVLNMANQSNELVSITVRGKHEGTLVPKHGYRIVKIPDPVPGERLMQRLSGMSSQSSEEMEDWAEDIRGVREESRPDASAQILSPLNG